MPAGAIISTRPPGGLTSAQWKELLPKADAMLTCWGRCRPEDAEIPHKFEYEHPTKTTYSCMICGRERTAVLKNNPATPSPRITPLLKKYLKEKKEIKIMAENPLQAAIGKAVEEKMEKIVKIEPGLNEAAVEAIVRRVIGEMLGGAAPKAAKKAAGKAKTAKTCCGKWATIQKDGKVRCPICKELGDPA
ncbi:hypothetical protein LCGC14_2479190 [marine sediment metagenome]|uniref:Uncharacterized protein n=1 Tax=marine sediment metagenome TaxID=412755 RepID=A0A0F9B8S9_9ZZZZ